jgi:hypothetical protein
VDVVVFDRVRVEPTAGSLQVAVDVAREERGGRVRLRGRRLEHRHREGGRPGHDPSRPAHVLRQRARGRGGAGRPGRCARTWRSRRRRDPARRPPRWRSSTSPSCGSRPASRTGPCARARRSWTPSSRGRCPRRSSRPRAWTSSATPRSRSSRGRTTRGRGRPRPPTGPPYQGANPVADVWSAKALADGGRFLRRAVADPEDVGGARGDDAVGDDGGVGFGSAGVHIPHACAYPIAGLKHATRRRATPTATRSSRTATPSSSRRPRRSASPTRPRPERHHHVAELLAGARSRTGGPTRSRTSCASSCATSARPRGSPSSATARRTCPPSWRAPAPAAPARGRAAGAVGRRPGRHPASLPAVVIA